MCSVLLPRASDKSARPPSYFQYKAILVRDFKARGFNRQVVAAGRQSGYTVLALLVRKCGALDTCFHALHNNPCTGNRKAIRIADGSGEFGILREQGRRGQQSERGKPHRAGAGA